MLIISASGMGLEGVGAGQWICMWFSSLDMRSPEVYWSTCEDFEQNNTLYTSYISVLRCS